MTIVFFRNKNTLRLRLLQKYLKIKDYPLFLPKGMQHTALVGKTMVRGGALAAQFRGRARGAIG